MIKVLYSKYTLSSNDIMNNMPYMGRGKFWRTIQVKAISEEKLGK